ncbi:MAG: hypothetical protein ACKVY0_13015 [Prosthecobacter sp.]
MSRTRHQPYRKSRAFDRSCRCHGSCGYCLRNRMHRHHQRVLDVAQQVGENDTPVAFGAAIGGRHAPRRVRQVRRK